MKRIICTLLVLMLFATIGTTALAVDPIKSPEKPPKVTATTPDGKPIDVDFDVEITDNNGVKKIVIKPSGPIDGEFLFRIDDESIAKSSVIDGWINTPDGPKKITVVEQGDGYVIFKIDGMGPNDTIEVNVDNTKKSPITGADYSGTVTLALMCVVLLAGVAYGAKKSLEQK